MTKEDLIYTVRTCIDRILIEWHLDPNMDYLNTDILQDVEVIEDSLDDLDLKFKIEKELGFDIDIQFGSRYSVTTLTNKLWESYRDKIEAL